MSRVSLFFALCFSLLPVIVQGQDATNFTQFFINPYSINPSYAGIEGRNALYVAFRKQWAGIEGAPTISQFAWHAPTNFGLNFGFTAISDKRGILNNTGALITFGYALQFDKHKFIRFGVSFGGAWNGIDVDKLDETDPALLKVLDNNASLLGNAGLSIHLNSFHMGASLPNIFSPSYVSKDAFTITEVSPFQAIIVHASNRFYLSKDKHVFEPYVLYRINTGLPSQFEVAGVLHLNHVIWFGGSLKQDFGISALGGIKMQNFFLLGGSYSLKNTGANELNSPTFEIQLSYLFGEKRKDKPVYSFVNTVKEKEKKKLPPPVRPQQAAPIVAKTTPQQEEQARREEEARKQQEAARAEEERRQQQALQEQERQQEAARQEELRKQQAAQQQAQEQARIEEARRQEQARLEEQRRQQQTQQEAARQEELRKQQAAQQQAQEQARIEEARRQEQARLEEQRRQQEAAQQQAQEQARLEEQRRQQQAQQQQQQQEQPPQEQVQPRRHDGGPRLKSDVFSIDLPTYDTAHHEEQARLSRLEEHAADPDEHHGDDPDLHPHGERHEYVKRGSHREELKTGEYVIGGVFKTSSTADRYADGLKKLGFKADYGYLSEKNLWYVYIVISKNINTAKAERDNFRKMKIFRDAWLLTVEP
jgi:type IX secretion system PorP/SprF family membrane protein